MTLIFNPDYTHHLIGDIRRGMPLKIIYFGRRLPEIRGEYVGQRAWTILAHYKFSPGDATTYVNLDIDNDVFGSDRNERNDRNDKNGKSIRPVGDELMVGEIMVPSDAQTFELYFSNTGRWGTTWDSRYGQNYIFNI
jgi:hypothetical protein